MSAHEYPYWFLMFCSFKCFLTLLPADPRTALYPAPTYLTAINRKFPKKKKKRKKVGRFNVRCFLPFSIQLQAHISLQTAVFNLVSSDVWKNFVLIYYRELFSCKFSSKQGWWAQNYSNYATHRTIARTARRVNWRELCVSQQWGEMLRLWKQHTRGGAREIVGVLARERKNRGREGERREIKTAQEDSRQNGGKNPSEVPPCSCRLSPSSSSRPSSSAAWKVRWNSPSHLIVMSEWGGWDQISVGGKEA